MERTDHPYFLCTQFHPEFNSHPGRPSPPFVGLLLAAANQFDEVCTAPPTGVGWADSFAQIMRPVM